LVHRDVKPSNVLLDGREHAYLADFGLTKRLGEPHSVEPGVLGTIDYVAPEQIRGEKVDARADEYSLGCLLYECLIGEPPFARSTHAAVLFAHLEEHPPAPAGLEVVMRTALAKEPGGRYPTCVDLVIAASEALGVAERGRSPGLPFLMAGVVCPFKGLSFFDRADAEFFCGRERVVSEVVARLAASTLVGILGPSGIGKSSLLRAGVLPALSAGVLPRSAEWRQILFRPGGHPCGELMRALGGEGLDSALARLAPDERIVVAVDQLEELFTACEGEQERAAFLEQLASAALDRDRRALILCSLRADFYGRLVSYPAFAQLLKSSHALVGPMDSDELARAIEEPASRAGLEVERPLVEALVSDVAGEPGGLPLLSTMLLELWQTRDRRTLRYESYRTSGGVRGAVARLAERAFVGLDESGRRVARNVMLRLVSGDDAAVARRRVPISELREIDGADRVLATLTDARLVTVTDGEVEVSHEALLEEWPRYRGWLEEDRVGRQVHAHVTVAAREWDARGRDPGDLYRGARLAGAQEWAAQHDDLINPLERDFLQTSDSEAQSEARRQRAQNRRLRWLAAGAGLLLALALVAVVFAEVQKGRANQQRRTAQSLQLATSAQATLGADPELSALLALQGLRMSNTDQAAQALRDALSQLRLLATVGAGGALNSAAFNPDGTEFVTASYDGTARIWSVSGHKQLGVLTEPGKFGLSSAAFSHDGNEIVTASYDSTARIWSASTYRQLTVLTEPGHNQLSSATFSPNGKEIVTCSGGTARIWSVSSRKPLATVKVPGGGVVQSAEFNPNGNEIVTADDAGAARIWSTRSHKQLAVVIEPGPAPLNSAAFSPDGKDLVTASADGSARIWSVRSRQALVMVKEPGGGQLLSAGFSPDGKEIVTAGADRTARAWSASTGKQLFVLADHTGAVQTAAFSPSGSAIVTASYDGTAKLWNAAPLEQLGVLAEPGKHLFSVEFTPAGNEIVSLGAFGIVRIWSASTYKRLAVVRLNAPGRAGPTDIAAVSPDRKEIVTVSQGRSAQVWSVSSHKRLGELIAPAGGNVAGAEFSPNGREIVGPLFGTVNGMAFWSASSHKLFGVIAQRPSAAPIARGLFSRDDKEIAGLGMDGTVHVWSATSHTVLAAIPERSGANATDAEFSPDGKQIVTANSDGTARVWSVTGNRQLGVLTEPGYSELLSAEFSPDGKQIMTVSADGTARIWSATDYGQLTVIASPNDSSLTSAAFSPDGKRVVTTGDDDTVRVWSTELAGPVRTIKRIAEMRLTRQLTPSERKTYRAGI
jgi:WD40 repeat protein